MRVLRLPNAAEDFGRDLGTIIFFWNEVQYISCFDNLWVRRISTLNSSLAQVYFVKTELAGNDECRRALLPWWDFDQILIWIVWMSHFFKFNRVSGLFYWKSQKWFDYRFTKSNLTTWQIRISSKCTKMRNSNQV